MTRPSSSLPPYRPTPISRFFLPPSLFGITVVERIGHTTAAGFLAAELRLLWLALLLPFLLLHFLREMKSKDCVCGNLPVNKNKRRRRRMISFHRAQDYLSIYANDGEKGASGRQTRVRATVGVIFSFPMWVIIKVPRPAI